MGLPEGCFLVVMLAGGLYSLGALMETKKSELVQIQVSSVGLTLAYEILLIGVDPVHRLKVVDREGSNAIDVAVGGTVRNGLLLEKQSAQRAALASQALGEGSGINAVNGGNALLFEPCAKGGLGQEVGVVLASVGGGDETSDVNLGGLEMGRQVAQELVNGLPRGNAIVANQGKGDDQNLAAV